MKNTTHVFVTVKILEWLKANYPKRLSSEDIEMVTSLCRRSAQRKLNNLMEVQIVYSDNECPAGWRLTEQGKQLLGIQGVQ